MNETTGAIGGTGLGALVIALIVIIRDNSKRRDELHDRQAQQQQQQHSESIAVQRETVTAIIELRADLAADRDYRDQQHAEVLRELRGEVTPIRGVPSAPYAASTREVTRPLRPAPAPSVAPSAAQPQEPNATEPSPQPGPRPLVRRPVRS